MKVRYIHEAQFGEYVGVKKLSFFITKTKQIDKDDLSLPIPYFGALANQFITYFESSDIFFPLL